MTLDAAIARARALDAAATAGWPGGYAGAAVRRQALECDAAFRAAATTRERARAIVKQLSAVEAAW